jgi:DNA polymerase III delta subunit
MLRLYVGDDLVQMEEALGELLSQLGPSAAQGAVVRFEGASADLDELAMACQSAPFLGSTRVVVVRELGGRLLALDEAAKRALLGALGSLAPTGRPRFSRWRGVEMQWLGCFAALHARA